MTHSSSQNLLAQLKKCLSLAQDMATHAEANQAFEPLRASDRQEVIAARRSAAFWQQMGEVEKDLSDRMLENMAQLRRN